MKDYLLSDLLINCRNDEIQWLIYNSYNLYINEGSLKEDAINKVYNILPQVIITILPKK